LCVNGTFSIYCRKGQEGGREAELKFVCFTNISKKSLLIVDSDLFSFVSILICDENNTLPMRLRECRVLARDVVHGSD